MVTVRPIYEMSSRQDCTGEKSRNPCWCVREPVSYQVKICKSMQVVSLMLRKLVPRKLVWRTDDDV